MKKKLIWGAVALLAVICLFGSLYTVSENQYACRVRFSKIIETTETPGLHFKLPFLDSVKYFPKATMLYDIPPSEVLTSDKQNMTVDSYVLWRVSDPLLFYQSLGSTVVAEERLDALTYNTLKNFLGTLSQSDIINMDDAAKLEAEGEAEYMKRLAAAYNTEEKQSFYQFTLALDALKQSLSGGEKTIILGEDSPLAQILLKP